MLDRQKYANCQYEESGERMDAAKGNKLKERAPEILEQLPEHIAWFSVSGDTDDFIYYDEPDSTHSER